jgi:hypothetical protein
VPGGVLDRPPLLGAGTQLGPLKICSLKNPFVTFVLPCDDHKAARLESGPSRSLLVVDKFLIGILNQSEDVIIFRVLVVSDESC